MDGAFGSRFAARHSPLVIAYSTPPSSEPGRPSSTSSSWNVRMYCKPTAAIVAQNNAAAAEIGPLSSAAIPFWYDNGMSVQLTVRIPDELAGFVDQDVAEGRAVSRADAIAKALAREQRRRAAERDVELLLAHRGKLDDLEGLAEHAASTPLELD
jgi:Arc/MetJ-type ribon-helix-helix transcriptional regulator